MQLKFIPLFFLLTISLQLIHADSFPDDEWSVISPADVGIDQSSVESLVSLAFKDSATQAIVIIKNGKIIGERYADGYDKNSHATSWSMAKSYYAALIGISLEKGEISSLDDPVSLYLDYFNDSRKVITIRDILNMSSGLSYPDHQHETMFFKSDQLKYSKKIKLQKEPNTLFEYNNVNSMLIGDILHAVTGKRADILLKDRILDPSGTKNYKLWKDEAGNTLTYCCIDMSAREFSRFGLLFARDGNWNGNQIVPKSYVDETFQVVWETPNWFTDHKRYYSMHWWVSNYTDESKIFNASGKYGQYIFVDRENDIVVTRVTKYPQRDLGDVQKWGPLKTFSWLGVKTSIIISRFLLDTGIIKEGRNVVTPVTLEEGESSKFYKNYHDFIEGITALSD